MLLVIYRTRIKRGFYQVIGDENTLEENGDIKPMSVSRERLVPVLVKQYKNYHKKTKLLKRIEELESNIYKKREHKCINQSNNRCIR